jgi:hypothetical protein
LLTVMFFLWRRLPGLPGLVVWLGLRRLAVLRLPERAILRLAV